MARFSSAADRVDAHPRYWSAGATFLSILLAIVASKVVEFRVIWAVYAKTAFGSPTDDLNPATASALAGCVILTTFMLAAVLLRRGAPIREYLAIRAVDWRGILPELVLGVTIGLVVNWIRLPAPTEARSHIVAQDLFVAYFLLLVLWLPLVEEALFRGFAIAGFLTSRFGSSLAVPLSAALWSFAHAESSWTGYAGLFVFGCVLGILRVRNDSLLPPLALHVIVNLAALGAVILL